MQTTVRVGISTCPNDTFAFHAILTGAVQTRELNFEIELLDIQQLNRKLFQAEFDIVKASFHAALLVADRMLVLPTGSALGYGVGPLLLSRSDVDPSPELASGNATPADGRSWLAQLAEKLDRDPVILCPGEHTTATLLFRIFFGDDYPIRQVVFSEIMPGLQSGNADLGVCIHEGRFTWQDQGLGFVADLGTLWEYLTESALPLGGLLGTKQLDREILIQASSLVRQSIEYGLTNREATLPTLRKYAQEFSDDVLMAHVDLYVNQWTIDLGEFGRRSLKSMARQAAAAGIVPSSAAQLEILPGP